MSLKINDILLFLDDRRLVCKAIIIVAPSATQVVSFNIAAKNNTQVHRQRISQRGEANFIAGWSRSSQHATIRYIVDTPGVVAVQLRPTAMVMSFTWSVQAYL